MKGREKSQLGRVKLRSSHSFVTMKTATNASTTHNLPQLFDESVFFKTDFRFHDKTVMINAHDAYKFKRWTMGTTVGSKYDLSTCFCGIRKLWGEGQPVRQRGVMCLPHLSPQKCVTCHWRKHGGQKCVNLWPRLMVFWEMFLVLQLTMLRRKNW